jgi:hypothetical protein
MKILICGCSFSSGWGFAENIKDKNIWPNLVAKNLNATVTNLSVAGCDNIEIFLNTLTAIQEQKFDRIIVQWTSFDRIIVTPASEHYTMITNDNPCSDISNADYAKFYKVFLELNGMQAHWNRFYKIVNILPKVFTTQEQSPLAIPDPTSSLYKFLDGISLTYEQLTTFADLLQPQRSYSNMPYSLLANQRDTFGLTPEPNLPIKNQKMLVREALYMYQHKGTMLSLNDYVESLTGWAPTTTISSNLLLSPQDSTFYQTTGNWIATNATITSDSSQATATGANVIDNKYSCKIIASAAGSMSLGKDSPIMKAFSVFPSTSYSMSFQAKRTAGTGTIGSSITYYDFKENALTTDTATTLTPTTSWQVS